MKWNAWVLAGVMVCSTGAAMAQMDGNEKVAIGSAVEPAKAQDALLSLYEHELMGVVEAMPADKFNFAPQSSALAGSKFGGVRTFAQEATHVAGANFYFFMSFGGPKPTVDMKSLQTMTSKDQILQALKASFAYAHQAIATITPANAYTAIQGADGMHTRATVASFAVAHGYDHYGQMVEYLRLNGIVPPGSK